MDILLVRRFSVVIELDVLMNYCEGHAIETLVTPELLHGECVSIGMVLETKVSHVLGHLTSSFTLGRLMRCLQSYKLPIHIPKQLSVEKVIEKMTLDKKNAGKKIRCVILKVCNFLKILRKFHKIQKKEC